MTRWSCDLRKHIILDFEVHQNFNSMLPSLLKRTCILLLVFGISAITCHIHVIADIRQPSLEVAVQEKLKTVLHLTNLQISFKNILHSKEPALRGDTMRDLSTAIFAMRNHQWYQLELNPVDRLVGFNIGQRFPRNTLLDNQGFFGIFGHFSISSHLIGGKYYKKLMPGFGVEIAGLSHKWTIGLAQRVTWQSSKTPNTVVDCAGHVYIDSYYFRKKGRLGCINPFIFGSVVKRNNRIGLVKDGGLGFRWTLPAYCSLSMCGKVIEKDPRYPAYTRDDWKTIWSITVDYLPFKAEEIKRDRLLYGLYSRPDIQLPNAFRDLSADLFFRFLPDALLFSNIVEKEDCEIFSKMLEQIGAFTSYNSQDASSFLEQQIDDKHYRIASVLLDKVPGSVLMETQERQDDLVARMIRDLYSEDSMPVFDEKHFNCFKKLLEKGTDHTLYRFSLPVQGAASPRLTVGAGLMLYYHNIFSENGAEEIKNMQALQKRYKERKRVLTLFPPYIVELIFSGMAPPFKEIKKLRDRIMDYALQNNKVLLFPSIVNLYNELKSELLFRVDDNLKEQKYLSPCFFYKPFIKRYIKEYKMIQQSFPRVDRDIENKVSLPNQWYRTNKSERTDLINIAINCRMFKQRLLPSEIHDMIESEVLQKGMIEYLQRIKTSDAFLFPDELPDLPEEPLMKFFISSLFLKNDNLSQKFNMIETKAVSLWGAQTPIVETK